MQGDVRQGDQVSGHHQYERPWEKGKDNYAVQKAVRVRWQRQGNMDMMRSVPWTQVGTKEEVATLILKACHVAGQVGSGTLEGQMGKNSRV